MIKAFILDLNGIVRNLETISKQIEAHKESAASKSKDMVFSDAWLFIKKCQDMNIPLILKSSESSEVVEKLLRYIHLQDGFIAIVSDNLNHENLRVSLEHAQETAPKDIYYDDLFEYPQDWQRERQLQSLIQEKLTETLCQVLEQRSIPKRCTISFESQLSCIEAIQNAHIPVVAIDRQHKMDPSEQLLKLVNSFGDLSIESLLMADQKIFGRS